MAKNDRRRTMVFSNVNKKADYKSASRNKQIIDLDDEIIIGIDNPIRDTEKRKINKKQEKNNKNIKPNDKQKRQIKDEKGKIEIIEPIIDYEKTSHDLTFDEKIRIQKKRIIRKISTFLLILVLLIGGIVYLFMSPANKVKKIEVVNNVHISSQEIINSSSIKLEENMFKFSKKEVKEKLLSNPYLEDVKINRDIFTNKVKIDVKERIATMMLEYGNSYVYIDNQGFILEISAIKIDTPILKGYVTPLEEIKPGNRLNKDDLERLEVVLNIMKNASNNDLDKLITHIDMNDAKNFILTLESEDKTVYLGECLDLSTQMLYIKEMIQREKGKEGEFYVNMDLNTSNPVFREKV